VELIGHLHKFLADFLGGELPDDDTLGDDFSLLYQLGHPDALLIQLHLDQLLLNFLDLPEACLSDPLQLFIF